MTQLLGDTYNAVLAEGSRYHRVRGDAEAIIANTILASCQLLFYIDLIN